MSVIIRLDVRRDRWVASLALTALLALVAVPGPVGSRSPGADPATDPSQLRPIVLAAAAEGMAPSEDDPALRSASALEPGAILLEPAGPSVALSRPAVSQPAAPLGAIAKNPWRFDANISWYGPGFYGRRTACGYALTASLVGVAHRTLPCGSHVTFRNPANGRVVVATVVDRGPYVSGRTFDMTAGLCRALGHCYTGSIYWKPG
jgi:rare lipoprotein A (peptidoglycan hydrolase)